MYRVLGRTRGRVLPVKRVWRLVRLLPLPLRRRWYPVLVRMSTFILARSRVRKIPCFVRRRRRILVLLMAMRKRVLLLALRWLTFTRKRVRRTLIIGLVVIFTVVTLGFAFGRAFVRFRLLWPLLLLLTRLLVRVMVRLLVIPVVRRTRRRSAPRKPLMVLFARQLLCRPRRRLSLVRLLPLPSRRLLSGRVRVVPFVSRRLSRRTRSLRRFFVCRA